MLQDERAGSHRRLHLTRARYRSPCRYLFHGHPGGDWKWIFLEADGHMCVPLLLLLHRSDRVAGFRGPGIVRGMASQWGFDLLF